MSAITNVVHKVGEGVKNNAGLVAGAAGGTLVAVTVTKGLIAKAKANPGTKAILSQIDASKIGSGSGQNVISTDDITLEDFEAMYRADQHVQKNGKTITKSFKNKGAVRFVLDRSGGLKISKVANKFNLGGLAWFWRCNVTAEHNQKLRQLFCDRMLGEWSEFLNASGEFFVDKKDNNKLNISDLYGNGLSKALGDIEALIKGNEGSGDDRKLLMRTDVMKAFLEREKLFKSDFHMQVAQSFVEQKINRTGLKFGQKFFDQYTKYIEPQKFLVNGTEYDVTGIDGIKQYVAAFVQDQVGGKEPKMTCPKALKAALDNVSNILDQALIAARLDSRMSGYLEGSLKNGGMPLEDQRGLRSALLEFVKCEGVRNKLTNQLGIGNLTTEVLENFVNHVLLPGGKDAAARGYDGLVHMVCSQRYIGFDRKVVDPRQMLSLENIVTLLTQYVKEQGGKTEHKMGQVVSALLEQSAYYAEQIKLQSGSGDEPAIAELKDKRAKLHDQILVACRVAPKEVKDVVDAFLAQTDKTRDDKNVDNNNVIMNDDPLLFTREDDESFVSDLRHLVTTEDSSGGLGLHDGVKKVNAFLTQIKGGNDAMQNKEIARQEQALRERYDAAMAKETMDMTPEEAKAYRDAHPFVGGRQWTAEGAKELFEKEVRENITDTVIESAEAFRFLRHQNVVDMNLMPGKLENVGKAVVGMDLKRFEEAAFLNIRDVNGVSGQDYVDYFFRSAMNDFELLLLTVQNDPENGDRTAHLVNIATNALVKQCTDAFRDKVLSEHWASSAPEAKKFAAYLAGVQETAIRVITNRINWLYDTKGLKTLIDKHEANLKAHLNHGGIDKIAVIENCNFLKSAMKGMIRDKGMVSFIENDLKDLFVNAYENQIGPETLEKVMESRLETCLESYGYRALEWSENHFYTGTLGKGFHVGHTAEEQANLLYTALSKAYERYGKDPKALDIAKSDLANETKVATVFYEKDDLGKIGAKYGQEISIFLKAFQGKLDAYADENTYHPLVASELDNEISNQVQSIWAHTVTANCPGRLYNIGETMRAFFVGGFWKIMATGTDADKEVYVRNHMTTPPKKEWFDGLAAIAKAKIDERAKNYRKFESSLMKACREQLIAVLDSLPPAELPVSNYKDLTLSEKNRLADGILSRMDEQLKLILRDYFKAPAAYDKLVGQKFGMQDLAARLLNLPLRTGSDNAVGTVERPVKESILSNCKIFVDGRQQVLNFLFSTNDVLAGANEKSPIERMQEDVAGTLIGKLKKALVEGKKISPDADLPPAVKEAISTQIKSQVEHVKENPYLVSFNIKERKDLVNWIAGRMMPIARKLVQNEKLSQEITDLKKACLKTAVSNIQEELELGNGKLLDEAQLERLYHEALQSYINQRTDETQKAGTEDINKLKNETIAFFKSSVKASYRLSKFSADQVAIDGAKLIVGQRNRMRDAMKQFGIETPAIERMLTKFHTEGALKQIDGIVTKSANGGIDKLRAAMKTEVDRQEAVVGKFIDLLAGAVDPDEEAAACQAAFKELCNYVEGSEDPNVQPLAKHLSIKVFDEAQKAFPADTLRSITRDSLAELLYGKASLPDNESEEKKKEADSNIAGQKATVLDYAKLFTTSECLYQATRAEVNAELIALTEMRAQLLDSLTSVQQSGIKELALKLSKQCEKIMQDVNEAFSKLRAAKNATSADIEGLRAASQSAIKSVKQMRDTCAADLEKMKEIAEKTKMLGPLTDQFLAAFVKKSPFCTDKRLQKNFSERFARRMEVCFGKKCKEMLLNPDRKQFSGNVEDYAEFLQTAYNDIIKNDGEIGKIKAEAKVRLLAGPKTKLMSDLAAKIQPRRFLTSTTKTRIEYIIKWTGETGGSQLFDFMKDLVKELGQNGALKAFWKSVLSAYDKWTKGVVDGDSKTSAEAPTLDDLIETMNADDQKKKAVDKTDLANQMRDALTNLIKEVDKMKQRPSDSPLKARLYDILTAAKGQDPEQKKNAIPQSNDGQIGSSKINLFR